MFEWRPCIYFRPDSINLFMNTYHSGYKNIIFLPFEYRLRNL